MFNGINFNQAGPKEKKILEEDCLSSLALIRNYIAMYCEKFNLTFNDCFITSIWSSLITLL